MAHYKWKFVSVSITIEPPPQVIILTNSNIDIRALTIDRYRIWYLLVNRESSISIGKGLLLKYTDENGYITPEGAERYNIEIQQAISDTNKDLRRIAKEAGIKSDTSEDEEKVSIETQRMTVAAFELARAASRAPPPPLQQPASTT